MDTLRIVLKIVTVLVALSYFAATAMYLIGEKKRAVVAAVSVGGEIAINKPTNGSRKIASKKMVRQEPTPLIKFKDYPKIKREGLIVNLVGIALNLVLVLTNWIINKYVPFVSMYQVLTFVSLCFPLTFLYIRYVKKLDWTLPCFSLCSALFITGVIFMDNTLIWHFPPALQSFYFLPHVMSYMLSYALCGAGFVLTIFMFIVKGEEKKDNYEKAIYQITLTAFPFMMIGIFLGALWANECWGGYWAWDSKETWALITMCLYALYFHLRKVPSLKHLNKVILVLAFIALLITFVGVTLFKTGGNHSYA